MIVVRRGCTQCGAIHQRHLFGHLEHWGYVHPSDIHMSFEELITKYVESSDSNGSERNADKARNVLRALLVAWLTAWERLTEYNNVVLHDVEPSLVDDICSGITNSAAVSSLSDEQLDIIQSTMLADRDRNTIGLCADCREPQFMTPSGVTCKNGHGGADTISEGALVDG